MNKNHSTIEVKKNTTKCHKMPKYRTLQATQRLLLDIFRYYREGDKPNYLFQRPKTELSVGRINLLSTVSIPYDD